jgi:hypothetical protein
LEGEGEGKGEGEGEGEGARVSLANIIAISSLLKESSDGFDFVLRMLDNNLFLLIF